MAIPAVAAAALLGLAAIPSLIAARPGDRTLVVLNDTRVAWAPSCSDLTVGSLSASSGAALQDGVTSCDMIASANGTLYASDLERSGRLVEITRDGARVLSPPGQALRTPVSPAPSGGRVAYCADVPSGRANTPHTVVEVAGGAGSTRVVGNGCQPAWTPSGLVYVSRFQRVFSELFGAELRVWTPDGRSRRLPVPPGTMLTDVTALPGVDSVAVVSVYPDASETLTVYRVAGRGAPWRVCTSIGGQVLAAAPMQGSRMTVAVSSRTGVTRLFLADTTTHHLVRLGRMPPGRALWSPDGRVLAWASAVGPWRVLDPVSGRLVALAPARGIFAALL
jgi:hypothetical protein